MRSPTPRPEYAASAPNAGSAVVPDETELVRRHADLVRRIAHHLAARLPSSVEIDDLIQAGIIGLIEAARHYSGDRGASFETYAGIRIRGAMLDELRATDWAPRSVHRRLREVAEAIREIEQATGRDARESEIAEKLGISLGEYHEIIQDGARCQVLSLDAGGEDGNETLDAPDPSDSPLEALQRREFHAALAEAIAGLPERERLVLSMYYDDEMNLREIGEVLDVSESRVCQIHGQALVRLRARLKEWKEMQAAA
ncbi:RNA polymerase, sigma 28 subunit, SigD/FliA/WhiG [Fontimonas thermophila]|uniref:RNA polymerase sigma factor FliA n=1 Tax=Fontimonas thermophila TaxID=1076937 RepID=A0A1I2IQN6_9GAMM|nr:RNA polymerase sigma factor FliA [Fontimonas thermophila]SFF43953.1 RNA polymerase, sigma 28 subunit, SigD/FliA/WhiG [Fontimonas thermophila]